MIFIFGNFTSLHSMISPRNQSQILWFFIPWIRLQVFFLKRLNFIISISDSSSDLIKFEEIIKKFPNSLCIWPLFTIIPINSWINLEIDKFGLYFDSWLCVLNDLLLSLCHMAASNWTMICFTKRINLGRSSEELWWHALSSRNHVSWS